MATGPSSYDPAFPAGTEADDRLRAFVADFYAVSDSPDRNDEWVSYFAPDAVLIMGDKMARGTEEIRKLRQGMWEKVESRRHRPQKVFPFPAAPADQQPGTGAGAGSAGTLEYMLHGSLDLGLKSGDVSKVTWAGRAAVREEEEEGEEGEGRLKFVLYQVYMHPVSMEVPL